MRLASLKRLREEKGKTQEQTAKGSDTSLRAIVYIEAGRGTTLNTAKRIAKFLGVTIDQLKEIPA